MVRSVRAFPDCRHFDLAIIGGGLSGAATAIVMSRAGASVVLFERSSRFRDRVRGDGLAPWGVVECREMGLEREFAAAGARELTHWDVWESGQKRSRRRTAEIDPHGLGVLAFRHARMQESLLASVRASGATVIRPSAPTILSASPTESMISNDSSLFKCRLIIGADGVRSMVRARMECAVRTAPTTHFVTGGIVKTGGIETDAVSTSRLDDGRLLLIPLGDHFARVYFMRPQRIAGGQRKQALIRSLNRTFALSGAAETAVAGAFASFSNADTWCERPSGPGYVLVGDAAGSNDPSIGQGMAIALRDVRELSSRLLTSNWASACEEYVNARYRYSSIQRMVAACAWLIDQPGIHGRRIRDALEDQGGARKREELMARIRFDPATVSASEATARCLLGGVDPPPAALVGTPNNVDREGA